MADGLTFQFDASGIARIEAAMRLAGNRTPDAIRRAINTTGDQARTQVGRALAAQTGLPYGVTRRALVRTGANYGSLSYVLRVAGGNIRLKYFKARETAAGVTAAPWGQRHLYPGTFTRGGHFPNRVPLPGLHGQVFKRAGAGRLPIVVQRSGLFLPIEATKGASAKAFQDTVRAVLPRRVEHEVGAILAGLAG